MLAGNTKVMSLSTSKQKDMNKQRKVNLQPVTVMMFLAINKEKEVRS